MAQLHPPWSDDFVRAVSQALGQTDWPGLSGSDIAEVLAQARVEDVQATITKWKRLYLALSARQARDGASNCIIATITAAAAPGRYLRDHDRFRALQGELDQALSLVGLRVNDEGRLAKARRAATLDDVALLAGRLSTALRRRDAHPEVLRYCQREVLQESTFHAVSEATKGLAERLRQISGLTTDGAELVDACFSTKSGSPILRINGYRTHSEVSEQKGFANLLKGVFGTFRNPTAHAPREGWPVNEADALDLFSTLSYLHRRLDNRR